MHGGVLCISELRKWLYMRVQVKFGLLEFRNMSEDLQQLVLELGLYSSSGVAQNHMQCNQSCFNGVIQCKSIGVSCSHLSCRSRGMACEVTFNYCFTFCSAGFSLLCGHRRH